MNTDEIKSLIVKLGIMILTAVATKLHLDPSALPIPAGAADIADLAVLGYGIYNHWDMKKVPETAIVVPQKSAPPKGI